LWGDGGRVGSGGFDGGFDGWFVGGWFVGGWFVGGWFDGEAGCGAVDSCGFAGTPGAEVCAAGGGATTIAASGADG
jgi:hypothetical protein